MPSACRICKYSRASLALTADSTPARFPLRLRLLGIDLSTTGSAGPSALHGVMMAIAQLLELEELRISRGHSDSISFASLLDMR